MAILDNLRSQVAALQERLQTLRAEAEAARAEMTAPIPAEPVAPEHAGGPRRVEIEISTGTILRIVIVTLGVFYLGQVFFQIGEILLMFFIGVIISAALGPLVDRLEAKRIPRSVSALAIMAVFLGCVGFLVSQVIPSVAAQVLALAKLVSSQVSQIAVGGDLSSSPLLSPLQPMLDALKLEVNQAQLIAEVQTYLEQIYRSLSAVTGGLISAAGTLFGGIFTILVALVIGFYLTVEDNAFEHFVQNLAPRRHRGYTVSVISRVKVKMGAWLRSQLILSTIIGVITWIGLEIIGVEFAAAAGLLAALTEFIPIIGPLIAGVPVTLLALVHGPIVAFVTGVFFLVLNSVESNVITPLVMKKGVGLSPLVVLIAMMVGQQLLGVAGIILAVPFATLGVIFFSDFAERGEE